jgi:2-enoate reductase
MVIGGGLAGMEAARVMAERGHRVNLYEKEDKLGGQFSIAGQQHHKQAYSSLIEYEIRGMKKAGVKCFLNTEMTVERVNGDKPDVVVVATGAYPMGLDVAGASGKNVVQANDVIIGKAKAGDSVLVVGGRLIAMEVALELAESGKEVALATLHRLGENGAPLENNLYRELRNRLLSSRVQIFENSPVVEIRDDGACILFHNEHVFLSADTIILAVGSKPNNKLVQELTRAGHRVNSIGDCVKPRDALLAMREGAEVGREI